MTSGHLSDSQLQQYVLDENGCNAAVLRHIALCDRCKKEAVEFRVVFAGIKQLAKPVPGYDLSALVLARLPKPAAKSKKNALACILACAAFVLLVLPVCLFWGLFTKTAIGVLPPVVWLLTAFAILIMATGCIEQYRGYKRKIATIRSYAGLMQQKE